MQELRSDITLPPVISNIATLLERNSQLFDKLPVFFEKYEGGSYNGIKWEQFYESILNIAWNLQKAGFQKGDKMVLFSRNCLKMLQTELAVMASGGIAVPVFSGFNEETTGLLITHSDAKFLAVGGSQQLQNTDPDLPLEKIWIFDNIKDSRFENLFSFDTLLLHRDDAEFRLAVDASPDEICLNMYTSGTMSLPKCVQLSHKNILSQQAAVSAIWDLSTKDRFLSYLPWHHSFGGIFELFSALSSGAAMYLESSYGKNPSVIMQNWKKANPTVFFSVPKIYRALVELTYTDKEVEEAFFNSGLKFIFTAAAALPEAVSDEFENRGIPVIEGWGLTETSPCCTLTDPKLKRQPGVVGMPIPGVEIRLAEDNEIQVKGPNVMTGYYKNEEANKNIFTADGWYKTGDVGELTPSGLKLITRKDRIFKLSNGEKVVPTDLEKLIELKCHYLAFAMVTGSGKEYPVALLFPNKKLIENPDYQYTPFDGCFCPRNLNELGKCLQGCLNDANCGIGQKFSKIKSAIVIDDELSVENGTLTPSMKLAPNNVLRKYKNHFENLYGAKIPVQEEIYLIELPQFENGGGNGF
jgi:long-subunit acyl-CoA synthetase (AMP-forming)